MEFPLVGGQFHSIPRQNDPQTCVNLYPVVASPLSKSMSYLYVTPGLVSFSAGTSGEQVRGMCFYNSILYIVASNTLYSLDSSGTRTTLGTLNTTTGRVNIINNRTQLKIDDGSYSYTYTIATGVLAPITDADYTVGNLTRFLDGYGISIPTNTNTFQLSGLNDFTTYAALDISSISTTADTLVSCAVSHTELWLLGTHRTEVWANTGAANFPFERKYGILINQGTEAPFSVIECDNSLFWLTKNEAGQRSIVRAVGYTVNVISNTSVNNEISQYTTVSDCFAFSYESNGQLFAVFTFPTEDKTFVYDVTASAAAEVPVWHIRSSQNPNNLTPATRYPRWRVNCYVYAFGKHLVGDFYSGTVYELSNTTYTEDSVSILRERTTSILSAGAFLKKSQVTNLRGLEYICLDEVELEGNRGIGLTSGQGEIPQVMLQVSKDGGITWGQEMWRSAGEVGQYLKRLRWISLGASRNWCFRLRTSDPVEWSFFSLNIKIRPGNI